MASEGARRPTVVLVPDGIAEQTAGVAAAGAPPCQPTRNLRMDAMARTRVVGMVLHHPRKHGSPAATSPT